MGKVKRVTKKSRHIEDFVRAIVDMVGTGQYDMSKKDIVEEVVKTSLSGATSQAVADILRAELGNVLETYFSEVIAAAGYELKLPYHLTSAAWYKRGSLMPQSEAEARKYVVVFGNGRTGRAAGVRYVTSDDEPDPMLLVSLNKRVEVINAAIRTHEDRLMKDLASPSVSPAIGRELSARLPHIPKASNE